MFIKELKGLYFDQYRGRVCNAFYMHTKLKFVKMLLKEMIEVQKPAVVYKENQISIFLGNSTQVGMWTKHSNICHHFLRDIVDNEDMDIEYFRSKGNPAYIMTKDFSGDDHA